MIIRISNYISEESSIGFGCAAGWSVALLAWELIMDTRERTVWACKLPVLGQSILVNYLALQMQGLARRSRRCRSLGLGLWGVAWCW